MVVIEKVSVRPADRREAFKGDKAVDDAAVDDGTCCRCCCSSSGEVAAAGGFAV